MAPKVQYDGLPKKITTSTVRLTLLLLEDVLTECGYVNGTWKIRFACQLRQKSNMKFKVIRQESRAIRVRTKAGNNSTAWEVLLTPPGEVLTQDVVTELQKVHGKKLTIPTPRSSLPSPGPLEIKPVPEYLIGQVTCGWRDKKTGKTCQQPAVEHIMTDEGEASVCEKHMLDPRWFGAASSLKNMTKRQTEQEKLKKVLKEQQKEQVEKERVAEEARAQKRREMAGNEREWELAERKRIDKNNKPKPLPQKKAEPQENDNDFEEVDLMIEKDVTSLRDNDIVLANALVAIAMVADNDGIAYRKKATDSIRDLLVLDAEFTARSGYTIVGAIREIVNGLSQQALIDRTSRSGARNNLYRLTDKAAQRLADYKRQGVLPENTVETEVVDEAEYEATVDKVADNFDEIARLVKALENLQYDSTGAQEVVEEIGKKRQTHEEAIEGIEGKLTPLREQIMDLQIRIEEHEKAIEELDAEAVLYRDMDGEAQTKITTTREQLRRLV